MSENEIRVLYVQPGKYPEERIIPNTLSASQKLVGGNIECCCPWRDSVCIVCNFLQALFSFVVVAGVILSA